jgi:hypothetical protein
MAKVVANTLIARDRIVTIVSMAIVKLRIAEVVNTAIVSYARQSHSKILNNKGANYESS